MSRSRISAVLWTAVLTLWTVVSSQKIVDVVFSNHLDVGYGGIAWTICYDDIVINKYFDTYFPQAIEVSRSLRTQNATARYVYTTQPWLASLYLDCPTDMPLHCPNETQRQAFAAAVARGDIAWHAMPFNTQPELFDATLLQSTIAFVHSLDDALGRPRSATVSQRDVPGMTRAIIPFLARNGIVAVNVGVNPLSSPPGVPHNKAFVWHDDVSNSSVLATWHPGGYGGASTSECVVVDGFDRVLCTDWRGDNDGPHAPDDVIRRYEELSQQFPGATVRAASFDDYYTALWRALPHLNLPVVAGEIGDTWVYGVASDPQKIADYRAVLRIMRHALQRGWCDAAEPAWQRAVRMLMKVPEHTWGVDVKGALNEWTNWSNADFHAGLYGGQQGYQNLIKEWVNQLAFINRAAAWLTQCVQWPSQHADARQLLARDRAARMPQLAHDLRDALEPRDVDTHGKQKAPPLDPWYLMNNLDAAFADKDGTDTLTSSDVASGIKMREPHHNHPLHEQSSSSSSSEGKNSGQHAVKPSRRRLFSLSAMAADHSMLPCRIFMKVQWHDTLCTRWQSIIESASKVLGQCFAHWPPWWYRQHAKDGAAHSKACRGAAEDKGISTALEDDEGHYTFSTPHWTFTINSHTGAIMRLLSTQPSPSAESPAATGGATAADAQTVEWVGGGSMLELVYSTYTEESYDTIWQHYMYQPYDPIPDWFYKDFGKPNCSLGLPQRVDMQASLVSVDEFRDFEGVRVVVKLRFPSFLVENAGAPRSAEMHISARHDSTALRVALFLYEKTPTRLPEAMWLRIRPRNVNARSWMMHKLSSLIDPLEVVRNGSQSMHAVQDDGIQVQHAQHAATLHVASYDAGLVSPGHPTPFPVLTEPPYMQEGMSFNLFNNIWGTNYIMWYPYLPHQADLMFRFQITSQPL